MMASFQTGAPLNIPYRRTYIDAVEGQVHVHIWGDANSTTPLFLCLPPSPYGGGAYATIAPYLVDSALIVAMDYPRVDNPPSIQDYAQAAEPVIDAFGDGRDVYLIGFHTGCLVAVETALRARDKISNIILIDVPFFSQEMRADLASRALATIPLSETLEDTLQAAWERSIVRPKETMPLARRFEMFLDHISRSDAAGQPFAAAFTYPCEDRFSALDCPCVIIATRAGLFEESCKTHALIKGARLVKDETITVSVLEQAADQTARHILECATS